MSNLPVVSVCMITYNHEAFIKQAIEGVLLQQTNFEIELIIADDCSTDQTETVIKQIIKNHPGAGCIKYFRHDTNIGIIPNFVFSLKKCSGKYIALCEGDDYWTDPLKLQKQADFLEGNPNFSGVASNSLVMYEDSLTLTHLFRQTKDLEVSTNDILTSRLFHTATFIFKKEAFKIDFPVNILSGDRMLFLLVSCSGNIKVLKDVTAVYRKNQGGISRKVTSKQMKQDYNMLSYLKKYSKEINESKFNAFIAYTVLEYSHKISIIDFIIASIRLVFYRFSDRKNLNSLKSSFKLINKNWTKMEIGYV